MDMAQDLDAPRLQASATAAEEDVLLEGESLFVQMSSEQLRASAASEKPVVNLPQQLQQQQQQQQQMEEQAADRRRPTVHFEEQPIRPARKRFEELVAEKEDELRRSGTGESPSPQKTQRKQGSATRPFLKRGSRNWSRVEALGIKVERESPATRRPKASAPAAPSRWTAGERLPLSTRDLDDEDGQEDYEDQEDQEEGDFVSALRQSQVLAPLDVLGSSLDEFRAMELKLAQSKGSFDAEAELRKEDRADFCALYEAATGFGKDDSESFLSVSQYEPQDSRRVAQPQDDPATGSPGSAPGSPPSCATMRSTDDSALSEASDNGKLALGELELQGGRRTKKVSRLVHNMFRTLEPGTPTASTPPRPRSRQQGGSQPTTAEEPAREQGAAEGEDDAKRMAQRLREEMAAFEKANASLQASLAKLEADRRQLDRERQSLERDKRAQESAEQTQVRDMREEMRRERAQLQRERAGLEKHKQHLELLRATVKVERKDKSQVETLQATIATMRVQEREKATRHKEALRSKATRISDLEGEVARLEEALKFTEARRLDMWERQRATQAKLESSESRAREAEALVEQLREELRAAAAATRLEDERNDNEEANGAVVAAAASAAAASGEGEGAGAQATENEVPEVEIASTATKAKKKRQRKRSEEVRPDGTRVVTYANGSIKEVSPDGSSTVVTYANGDMRKVLPLEGLEIYYFQDTDATQTTYGDGVVELEFPSGQLERTHPDGTLEVFFPDGTVSTRSPDGTAQDTFADGTTMKQRPDGSRIVLREFPGSSTQP